MRAMFAMVSKADPRVDRTLASLLGQTYKFKETADYGVGSQGVVSLEEAQGVIDNAQRFLDSITRLLSSGAAPPREPEAKP